MDSRKYGRTFHFDFSPGTTSDDRINRQWWEDMSKIKTVIHTEKLDGENTCQNEYGVFARSHAAPTRHPWANHLKEKYSVIKNDLKQNNLELFGENIYAQHSIIYDEIESHFYLFGIRVLDKWLSWEEVQWYSDFFEYNTVPLIGSHSIVDTNKDDIQSYVIDQSSKPTLLGSGKCFQFGSGEPCTKEGIVTRNIEEYSTEDMAKNVFKYVRKNHVKTDVHWSKNWQRAPLKWEKNKNNEN